MSERALGPSIQLHATSFFLRLTSPKARSWWLSVCHCISRSSFILGWCCCRLDALFMSIFFRRWQITRLVPANERTRTSPAQKLAREKTIFFLRLFELSCMRHNSSCVLFLLSSMWLSGRDDGDDHDRRWQTIGGVNKLKYAELNRFRLRLASISRKQSKKKEKLAKRKIESTRNYKTMGTTAVHPLRHISFCFHFQHISSQQQQQQQQRHRSSFIARPQCIFRPMLTMVSTENEW